jgi:hypothetical protein
VIRQVACWRAELAGRVAIAVYSPPVAQVETIVQNPREWIDEGVHGEPKAFITA